MAEKMNDRRVIGGHRGLDVYRIGGGKESLTIIRKQAKHEKGNMGPWLGVDLYDHNVNAVNTEATMLAIMADSGYTPDLFDHGADYIDQTDLGDTEPYTDGELFRRNCVKMLATIRANGLRHGDLIGSNIITRGNHPYAIDWQEGHLLTEPAPQKQPWSDSHLLMRHIVGTAGADGQMDIPRVARRWDAVLGALGATMNFRLPLKGKTFLDLGCFQGDFVALAAAEGMHSSGIDQGGFRSGENSIEIARELWKGFPFGHIQFDQLNITNDRGFGGWDVVMMFSTWPYIVQDYGWDIATETLARIIKDNEVLFFETQLSGDGPGPVALKADDDVAQLLRSLRASTVNNIGTFPVTGRPASRTVWEVRK